MHRSSWAAILAAAFATSVASAAPYTAIPLQKPNPGAADQFGFSAAAVGGFVLVGAPGENKSRGAAYLFNGRTGALVREFRRADGQRDDQFGFSLSTSGAKILIGAPGTNNNTGAAFEYDLTVADDPGFRLPRTGGTVGDRFGWAVASAGTRILVGAPRRSRGSADDAGAAYLYDGVPPAQTFLLEHPGISLKQDQFGYAGAFVGTVAAVGAPYDDRGPRDGGALYLFDVTNGNSLGQPIQQPNPSLNDRFGFAVTALNGKIVVGAPRDGEIRNGIAYLFDPTNPATPTITFVRPDATRGDAFGAALASVGSRLLVGAPKENTPADDAGAAYLFDAAGAVLATFTNPTPAKDDHFATAVAATGANLVIGSPDDDANGTNAGLAYLYIDQAGGGDPCDDANDCTIDAGVDPLPCSHTPIAGCCVTQADCDDQDVCNGTSRCENDLCVSNGDAPACGSDGIACTRECNPSSGCLATPEAPAGWNGLFCWLGALNDTLEEGLPTARNRVAQRLVRMSSRVFERSRIAKVAADSTKRKLRKKAPRVLRRVDRRLVRFVALTERGRTKQRLEADLASAVSGLAGNARATIPPLKASVTP